MILKFENGATINAPNEIDIQNGVDSLTPAGNGFIILQISPGV